MTEDPDLDDLAIAVVGMAGRFPGAPDIERFWQMVCDGTEGIAAPTEAQLRDAGVPPETLSDPRYVRARGALVNVEHFDAEFFGYSPREAEAMDPQHRVFLECAWEALEHAGIDPQRPGGSIGVYAGAGADGYLVRHVLPARAAQGSAAVLLDDLGDLVGNDRDFLTTRLAYKLDLRGPAVTVQTACSTSLVAIQMACQALLGFQCDAALAGGVSIAFPLGTGYLHREGHILSPDGHCRPFDAGAAGTVPGDGVGVVVLKRLADARTARDTIHAVIRAATVNNDGAAKVGYTAPGLDGQSDVIALAHEFARISPDTIGLVEAHGTGTLLGDPIEVAALTQAFRKGTTLTGFCALGSVKGNVGHLNTAAGIASFLKATLAVGRGVIPPSLHFRTANPDLALDRSPFHVPTTARPWPAADHPRRAGVSSFGFGGTNAHVLLEAPPPPVPFPVTPSPVSHRWQVATLSARTPAALDAATARLADHLRKHPETPLAHVAFTLQTGRRGFVHRRAVIARDATEAAESLSSTAGTVTPSRVITGRTGVSSPSVVLLFPGQGSQRGGMAAGLHATCPVFRDALDACCAYVAPRMAVDLRGCLLGTAPDAAAQLARTSVAQPALFIVGYALARTWLAWGVRPAAMIGHSLGEYVAACVSGVFQRDDALALVVARGLAMETLPPGAMLAIPRSEADTRHILDTHSDPGLALAAVNSPQACVVSGPVTAVSALEASLHARGVPSRRLSVAHAFHSAMMDPVLAAFEARVAAVARSAPAVPFLSNVTGTWITPEEAVSPGYWSRHLRRTVRFADSVRTALSLPCPVLVETGPGRVLTALATDSLAPHEHVVTITSMAPDDPAHLAGSLGRLWTLGLDVDWHAVHADESPRKVPLPTYPFERRRYTLAVPATGVGCPPAAMFVPGWREAPRVVPNVKPLTGPCILLDPPAGLAEKLTARGVTVTTADPQSSTALDGLFAPQPDGALPTVFDLRPLRNPQGAASGLLALLQAAGRRHLRARLHLVVVTPGLLSVTSPLDCPSPIGVTVRALCETAAVELHDVTCRLIDADASVLAGDTLADELLTATGDPVTALRGTQWLVPTDVPVTAPQGESVEVGPWLVIDDDTALGDTVVRALTKDPAASVVRLSARQGTTVAPLDLDAAERELRAALAIVPIEARGDVCTRLDALCTAYLVDLFTQGGVAFDGSTVLTREALAQRLCVQPRFHRLIDAWVDILVQDGCITVEDDTLRFVPSPTRLPVPAEAQAELRRDHPGFSGMLDFLAHCAPRHANAISGRIEAIGVLYPGGTADFIARCERATLEHRSERVSIHLLRDAVCALVRARRAECTGHPVRPVRILEIGGGSGGLTWPMMAALAHEDITWHFTDLGRVFADDARREAARRGVDQRMTFGTFDASRAPEEQGVAPGAYDFVLAFNVVHATPDVPRTLRHLARTLAPGGTLGFIEVVKVRRWDTLTWGLAEGWWYFNDPWRTRSPLMPLDTWEAVLQSEGFEQVTSYPRAPDARARLDHGLLLARRPQMPTEVPVVRVRPVERVHTLAVDPCDRAALDAALGPIEALSGPIRRALEIAPHREPSPIQRLAVERLEHTTAPSGLDALGTLAGIRPLEVALTVDTVASPRFAEVLDRTAAERTGSRADVRRVTLDGVFDPRALAQGLRRAACTRAPTVVLRALAPSALPTEETVPTVTLPGAPPGAPRMEPSVHPRPALAVSYAPPRTDTERQVAALCADLLGVDRVGIDDDLIALGADSLITLRLTDRLREVLGRDVPANAAFRGATVARIVAALQTGTETTVTANPGTDAGPLVAIQPLGHRAPMFFVHPAAGVVFPYYELARLLGTDRPFHAFQASGLDGVSAPDTTIAAMAERYVTALRTAQPRGPYHLGGFSFGCLVAFDMALRLADAGEQVGLLALVDEPAPLEGHRPPAWIMARLLATGIARSIWPHLHDYLYLRNASVPAQPVPPASTGARAASARATPSPPEVSRGDNRGGSRGAGTLEGFLARSTMANYIPRESRLLALRQPAMLPMFDLFKLHLRETVAYVPRAYSQRVTLFKANRIGGRYDRDPTWGWRLLAAGGVEVHQVPGEHLTVLRQPHVRVLAQRLRACLDAADPER